MEITSKPYLSLSILTECGKALQRGRIVKGKKEIYKIKVFNTIDFEKSMHYNPFAYIKSEKDILKLVTALIVNTRTPGTKQGEEFWENAEKLLYMALIGYIWEVGQQDEQNFSTLLLLLNSMEVHENDEDYMHPVDILFHDLEEENPNCFAVLQYKKFKQASGKTLKSILSICGSRLAVFDIKEIREITLFDELELDKLGSELTALFLIMSDTDSTFNFLISMIYTQMFDQLCMIADKNGGKLKIHVRCLMDEVANIGQIPELEKKIATLRSREISTCLFLQSKAQLKAIYKDHASTIIDNCDSQLFLGGTDPNSLKELSVLLGKETIDLYNTSETRSNQKSFGLNYQKTGKELMSSDEISVMSGKKCILQLRGIRPFYSDKYDLTQHPNYKLTSDYDKRNILKVERLLEIGGNLVLKGDDIFEEIDTSDYIETDVI